jgi:TPR repeat protein
VALKMCDRQSESNQCLIEGIGIAADQPAGIALVKRSADQCIPFGQDLFAIYLERRKGVSRDLAMGMEWNEADAKASSE